MRGREGKEKIGKEKRVNREGRKEKGIGKETGEEERRKGELLENGGGEVELGTPSSPPILLLSLPAH